MKLIKYYMASKNVNVTILPTEVKKFSIKTLEGGLQCSWKKMNFNNVKCIIQASEDKKFRKYVVAKPYPELRKGYWRGIGLKRNRVYYVKIRQITKFNDDFHFGNWSKIVKVRTK